MGILKSIQKIALTPSVAVGNLISKGITAVTGIKTGTTTTSQLQSTTAGKILGTAIAGTAAALAVAAAPAGSISAVARAAVPSTVKGKITAAVAVPVIAGVLSENPKAPFQIASNLARFGSDIGKFSADPSSQAALDIAKNSPLITAGLGIAAISGLGKAAGSAVGGIIQSRAIKEQTQAIIEGNNKVAAVPSLGSSLELPSTPKEIQTSGNAPVMPETEELYKPRRKRTRSKAQGSTIKQTVRVNVGVNAGNKRYLNTVSYVR